MLLTGVGLLVGGKGRGFTRKEWVVAGCGGVAI